MPQCFGAIPALHADRFHRRSQAKLVRCPLDNNQPTPQLPVVFGLYQNSQIEFDQAEFSVEVEAGIAQIGRFARRVALEVHVLSAELDLFMRARYDHWLDRLRWFKLSNARNCRIIRVKMACFVATCRRIVRST